MKAEQATAGTGPEVTVWRGVDCHLDPDFSTTVNLGIDHFSGWNSVEFPALSRALAEIALMEAPERFNGQGCYDQNYISGLARYAAALNDQAPQTPLDRAMLESVLRHGIFSESDPALRQAVADLFSQQGTPVQHFIADYLTRGCTSAGANLPFNFEVSTELCRAMANSLANLPDNAPALIKLIGRSAAPVETDISEAALEYAISSPRRDVVEAAVTQFKDLEHTTVEVLMQKCLQIGAGESSAEGIAAAYLLNKYPEDQNLREKIRLYTVKGSPLFLDELSSSHIPGAVALRLDQINSTSGISHSLALPLEMLKFGYRQLVAENQRERDLNRIAYHLGGSYSSYQENEVKDAITTLILSNHEPSLVFLRHQIDSPPNNRRAAIIEQALRETRATKNVF